MQCDSLQACPRPVPSPKQAPVPSTVPLLLTQCPFPAMSALCARHLPSHASLAAALQLGQELRIGTRIIIISRILFLFFFWMFVILLNSNIVNVNCIKAQKLFVPFVSLFVSLFLLLSQLSSAFCTIPSTFPKKSV